MKATVLRRARGADAALLVMLCAEHAAYERAAYAREGAVEALAAALDASSPRLFAWLAERDGVAVGYASAAFEYSTWNARDHLHMDCLYVCADARGAGIGRMLFDAVVAHARAGGRDELQWQTPAWNTDAARFYRRTGAAEAPKLRYVLRTT